MRAEMITQPTDLLSKNLKLLQISSHVILKILMQIKLGRKKIYNKYEKYGKTL